MTFLQTDVAVAVVAPERAPLEKRGDEGMTAGSDQHAPAVRTGVAIAPGGHSVSVVDRRNVVLEELYAERATLLRARRRGEITEREVLFLADLERYIDELEAEDVKRPPVLDELDALATKMLELQSRIEASQRR